MIKPHNKIKKDKKRKTSKFKKKYVPCLSSFWGEPSSYRGGDN